MNTSERMRAAEIALAVARRASDLVARRYGEEVAVRYKGANDPVTDADQEANALICEALAAAYPGIPIVAEESDPSTYAGYTEAEVSWFVDPLDGTRDFVKRNGEFAVMIGLAEGGRATLGVLVLPASGRAFVGGSSLGAFEIGAGERKVPLRVSTTSHLEDAALVVSRSRPSKAVDEAAARLGVRRVTRCGSAGLKGIRVATGEADAYPQPGPAGKLWDACAPDALVTAAGGLVTDARGEPFDYRSPNLLNAFGLVASNGLVHQALLGLLRQATESEKES